MLDGSTSESGPRGPSPSQAASQRSPPGSAGEREAGARAASGGGAGSAGAAAASLAAALAADLAPADVAGTAEAATPRTVAVAAEGGTQAQGTQRPEEDRHSPAASEGRADAAQRAASSARALRWVDEEEAAAEVDRSHRVASSTFHRTVPGPRAMGARPLETASEAAFRSSAATRGSTLAHRQQGARFHAAIPASSSRHPAGHSSEARAVRAMLLVAPAALPRAHEGHRRWGPRRG